jgi:hypothetical protein
VNAATNPTAASGGSVGGQHVSFPEKVEAWRDHNGLRAAIASKLRSMINGYQINSYTAFPFTRQRRHLSTNSQYAFKAAVL